MIFERQLIEAARRHLGARFRHQGRGGEDGLDCLGLILVPAREVGLTRFEPPNYGPEFDRVALVRTLTEHLHRIDLQWTAADFNEDRLPKAEAGDVLLFAVRNHPAHLAYATGEGTMIHATEKAGKVIEEPIGPVWQRSLLSVWRWPLEVG